MFYPSSYMERKPIKEATGDLSAPGKMLISHASHKKTGLYGHYTHYRAVSLWLSHQFTGSFRLFCDAEPISSPSWSKPKPVMMAPLFLISLPSSRHHALKSPRADSPHGETTFSRDLLETFLKANLPGEGKTAMQVWGFSRNHSENQEAF